MRERFKVESAFIPDKYLKEFYQLLESEVPTPEVVQANWSNLKRHFLNYFKSTVQILKYGIGTTKQTGVTICSVQI